MSTTSNESVNAIIETLRQSTEAMLACKKNDKVFAWEDTGLAVGCTKDGKVFVTGAVHAEPITPRNYNAEFKNGKGTLAKLVNRQDLIKKSIKENEEMIATLMLESQKAAQGK